MQALCDVLADILLKAIPSKSSPKKPVEQITSLQLDSPTKISTTTKIDQPDPVKSRGLQDKLALFPSIYGGNPTGKKTSMTPLSYHLLIEGTGQSRNRRPRLEYPADDSPIKHIPDRIAQAFAKETASVLRTYKAPYILCPFMKLNKILFRFSGSLRSFSLWHLTLESILHQTMTTTSYHTGLSPFLRGEIHSTIC